MLRSLAKQQFRNTTQGISEEVAVAVFYKCYSESRKWEERSRLCAEPASLEVGVKLAVVTGRSLAMFLKVRFFFIYFDVVSNS